MNIKLFFVLDYFVNNIPEPGIRLYKTPVCTDETKCLGILIRSDRVDDALNGGV